MKADREREARDGTPAVALGRLTLGRYARELYGADLTVPAIERFWLPELAARPLDTLTAADLRRVIDRLAARDGKDYLADGSIRRLFAPMSALLATAAEEGLVVGNVARDVTMPSGRDRLRKFAAGIEDDEDESEKALTREQLHTFLGIVDARHRTFFRLLASTGLR
jgi:integrase